jgi:hypothetical protein
LKAHPEAREVIDTERGLNPKDWRVLREATAAMSLVAIGYDKEIL